jgi:hypothetical protein
MQNNKRLHLAKKLLNAAYAVAPLVWITALFAFDKPGDAILSLIAIGVHEGGHVLALVVLGKNPRLRARADGVRIEAPAYLTPMRHAALLLAGPLANALAAAALWCIAGLMPLEGDYLCRAAAIEAAYAIANLIPVRGFDGFGLLDSLIGCVSDSACHTPVLSAISLSFSALLTYLSLYLMASHNGGYWAGFVFLFKTAEHIFFDKKVICEKKREKTRFQEH